MDKPNVYSYLNFRQFVEDFCTYQKQHKTGFSKRFFTTQVGLPPSSSSFITSVINGKRNLSQDMRGNFSRAMKLKSKEIQYFDLLVQFNQAKKMEQKNFFFGQLSKFRQSLAHTLKEGELGFYEKWYTSIVWNYIGMRPDQSNPKKIASEIFPPITSTQVQEAIQALLHIGLIKKTANGYQVTEKHVTTPPAVKSLWAKNHIKAINQIGLDVFDRVPASQRQYNTLSFHISERGFKAIKESIQVFQEELRDIIEKDMNEDRIFTLSMMMFPNTQLK